MKKITSTLITLLFSFAAFATAPITGVTSVCAAGDTTRLADATPGGTWSSSNTGVATITSVGIAIGITAGTTTITYDVSGIYATTTLTVLPVPASISGLPGTLCVGSPVTVSDATPGGSWSAVLSVSIGSSSGIVTGLTPGTGAVTYTLPTGCLTAATVNVSSASSVYGSNVCVSTSTTISSSSGSGTWTTTNTAVAVINPTTGLLTGMSPGTSLVTFYPTSGGCPGTRIETVFATPGGISGTPNVCTGTSNYLYIPLPGGTWSSSNTSVATVNSSGMVSGIALGTATISYSLGGSCYSTFPDTVITAPAPITGPSTICISGTATLYNVTGGGTWTSSNFSIANIGSSNGIVTGVSGGTVTLTYSFGVGCSSIKTIYVDGVVSGSSTLCIGSPITLTAVTPSGTWSSSNTTVATVGPTTGVVSGVSAGTAKISYLSTGGCTMYQTETVMTSLSPITGPGNVCIGSTNYLSHSSPGGTWSSSGTSIATISSSGLVSGMTAGSVTMTYTISAGCYATMPDTVISAPAPITGTTSICTGGTTSLYCATSGGTWVSSSSLVSVGTSTGVVSGVSAGTAVVTYTLGTGCNSTITVTVASGAVTVTSSSCGSIKTLTASGTSTTYSWSPSTGLSCTPCSSPDVYPTTTTTYVVAGSGGPGCPGTGTITVNGNRVLGHISFSSTPPSSPSLKVWLIQYNPIDSIITGLDSMITCTTTGGSEYYEFNGKPTGSYFVKAMLVAGGTPGSSGYIPTYGLSQPNWSTAYPVAHAGSTDSMDITMLYGTVPSGPGFISGNVYSGAGKGTSGDAAFPGMLVYLKDATTNKILTYTYTDVAGAYSFGSLANGSYLIYPEEYQYNTIPSAVIKLSPSNESVTAVNFKRHTSPALRITPVDGPNAITSISAAATINIYPNPASDVLNIQWDNQVKGNAAIIIADITGREVYHSEMKIDRSSGVQKIDVKNLEQGIYVISVKADNINYTGKLLIGK